jgi:hypothetical protein
MEVDGKVIDDSEKKFDNFNSVDVLHVDQDMNKETRDPPIRENLVSLL